MSKKQLKRKLEKKLVTVTNKELIQMKEEAIGKAAERINLMPLLILRDKFGFGKVRLERYLRYYDEMVEAFNEGRIMLDDIEAVMLEEVKIGFKKE